MTNQECLLYCRSRGFEFAGTQYMSQCYCGYYEPDTSKRLGNNNDCSFNCKGNANEKCGGSYRMNTWRTSVFGGNPTERAPTKDGSIKYISNSIAASNGEKKVWAQ